MRQSPTIYVSIVESLLFPFEILFARYKPYPELISNGIIDSNAMNNFVLIAWSESKKEIIMCFKLLNKLTYYESNKMLSIQ